MELASQHRLAPFCPADIPGAAELIGRAMNREERAFALRTFHQYFESIRYGIPDGRVLFVLKDEEAVIGIVGLHHYFWGPEENVWLSWFAVDPELHGLGLGRLLLDEALNLARQRGFTKLFIETYSSDTFAKARRFYSACGFKPVGTIRNYMPDGTDMVVYCRLVSP